MATRRLVLLVCALAGVALVRLGGAAATPAHAQSAPSGVMLCQSVNYGGRCQAFTSDVPDLRGSFVGDGQASSLRLAPGWSVSVYTGYNYGERCQTFTQDAPDLGATSIGRDTASSLRVNVPCASTPVFIGPTASPAIPPPPTPFGPFAIEATADTIVIEWSAPGSSATSFQVAWWEYGFSGDWTYVTVPAPQNFFVQSGLPSFTRFAYEVQACNSGGCSPWSFQLNVATIGVPPAAPTNLFVTGVLANAISIAWNDNSGNEQGFVVGYWQYGWSTNWTYVFLPANQNFFLLTQASPGVQYAFIVEAYNQAGYSGWSNQVNQFTHDTFP